MDTSAKFLVEDLLAKGIDTYFGVPGGPISPMFDAVLRTPGVTLIESRHETAALFEAIGYYKTTGKVPVVLVSAGPGIANCLNGIASAKALQIPLLLISGEVSWERSDQILLQNGGPDGLDIEQTFAAHTEKVLRIKNASIASKEILNFLDIRVGLIPSIIVLPMHVSNAQVNKGNYKTTEIYKQNSIDSSIVLEVARLINNATKPLLVLGYGAKKYNNEIVRLIESLQIPFVTTPQGKGLGNETHPLSLRNMGMGASTWIRDYLFQSPDVVLVLGTDLDDCAVGTTEFASDTKIIHVDLNSKVFNRKYKTELGIVADLKVFAENLINVFDASLNTWEMSLIENVKDADAPFDMSFYMIDEIVPVAPHRALSDLQKSSPKNVRFVTDIGEHMLFSLHYLTIKSANQFSIDLGLGSMGSGIGQAIGMCIGDKTPTICVVGDGCMQMHGMEILTAIKYNLPIIFAVFNDARYNMVHHGFKFLFGREENLGQTDYIDFVKFAESLGISGVQINKPGEITTELIDTCFTVSGPVILDIRINKDYRVKGAGRNEALKQMGEFDG